MQIFRQRITRPLLFLTAALALILSGCTVQPIQLEEASAAMVNPKLDLTTGTVYTHPLRGEVQLVPGASTALMRNSSGVTMVFNTTELVPGNIYTAWWVIVNDPAACETSPCTGMDAMGNPDGVQSDVGYATGEQADENGRAEFRATLPVGALPDGWFEHGLIDAFRADITVALHDHGPAVAGMEEEMMSTFRAGCTDASLPPAFPEAAFADGTPGDNECIHYQLTVFPHTSETASEASTAAEPAIDVNFYTSHNGHEHFGMIDLESGAGTDVGKYENPEVSILRTEWLAGNGAIYDDTFYVVLNKRLPADATPDDAEAHLARVNMGTGAVELVGSSIPLNLMALEIDPCGQMFASGFTLSNQIGELFGDTNLYRVDLENGSITLIGDTGIERIMDMSFDPEGTLWATVGNVLYTLDPETGTPTEVAQITGVEEDNEIMGIGYTGEGELYGTTPFSDGFYHIDPESGEATEVGRHGFVIPHGGDIPMVPQNTSCAGAGS